ncbi:MAG: HlyC/CorC family transporter [Ruminococcaceae bacterium]|nr:HlyC/CorC family transporter [Oscillospiraceae bacterium]MBR3596722.1 HlyC/CorC family transporter [Clostridia bacterium]
MNIWTSIILQVILIALNAVFAAAEIAIISVNDAKLAAMAAKGNKKAVRLARLTSTPAKFLATIQVAITLSGFLGSAFAADNFSEPLVELFIKMGVPETARGVLDSVTVVVITLILSYFTLVFGELVPKRVAMKKAESLALGISGLISLISKLFAPIVWFLTLSTNAMLRLFGIDPNEHEESVSEEEIRMMVDAGSEKGTIDEDEKELIQNVFEFDDLSADEIATHRTDIDLLWMDDTVDKWEDTIHESRHTFFPVCKDTVDNIVGVLNAKDYFRLRNKSLDNIMKNCVRPAFFVPETVKADVLFKNMKQKRNYFAVVLDEYGGMTGIVTITDILESIVGDFDEDTIQSPGEEPEIMKIDENTWKISGTAAINEVEEEMEISLDCEEVDTFGGYVFTILGIVPEDGETLTTETDTLEIKITEVKEHRIEKTLVIRKEKAKEDDKEEKDKQ